MTKGWMAFGSALMLGIIYSRKRSIRNRIKERFELFYWPMTIGRGEFMRLMFIETNTPFIDVYEKSTIPEVKEININRPPRSRGYFAMPAIRHTDPSGNIILLSQTSTIMHYLAKKLDGGRLLPTTEQDEYQAMMLMACVADLVEEGCIAWHAMDYNARYLDQKEQTQPFIDEYKSHRLPKWCSFFENILSSNRDGQGYFVGQSLSFADIAIFHIFHGIRFQCPEEYQAAPIPKVRAFMDRIENRPRIKQHLNTRTNHYDGTGPIF